MASSETLVTNPLVLEISSLKSALTHYQNAADTANIHLQRQALELSTLAAHCKTLEHNNTLLQTEVSFLRSNPDTAPQSATLQVSELTLALRKVSDQLDAAEKSLSERTEELTHAISAKTKAQFECESAFERVTYSKTRQEEAFEQIRQLELEVRGKEEERRLADLVVHEYADLVRTLEGRASSSVAPASSTIAANTTSSTGPSHRTASSLSRLHTPEESSHSQESSTSSNGTWSQSKDTLVGGHGASTKLQIAAKGKPVDSLNEGRAGLQRLLGEFHEQTDRLEKEVARLHEELAATQSKLESTEKAANQDRIELGKVHSELAKALREDKSAAKMVERYMSFSQQSTNLLQTALQTLRKRHSSSIATYEQQIASLNHLLEREKVKSNKLRETLDDLTLEIARETFGRRREIALRLSLLERERKIGLQLEKWLNGIRNHLRNAADADDDDVARWEQISEDARRIVSALRGLKGDHSVTESEEWVDPRVQAALSTIDELHQELEMETNRRLELERLNAAAVLVPESSLPSTGRAETQDVPTENVTSSRPSEEKGAVVSELSPKENEEYNEEQEDQDQHTAPVSPVQEVPKETPAALIKRADTEPIVDPKLQSLIEQLHETSKRYDSLQTIFNDCHDTLAELQLSANKELIGAGARNENGEDRDGNKSEAAYLGVAIERLSDYCEDARVELEILIADEARIAQGYETLLKISTSTSTPQQPTSEIESSGSISGSKGHDAQLLDKITAFIHGTASEIEKATQLFERKSDDLMHDIAVVKRAVHESIQGIPLTADHAEDEHPHPNGVPIPISGKETDQHEDSSSNRAQSPTPTWRTLASSILSSSPGRPSSPLGMPRRKAGRNSSISSMNFPSTSTLGTNANAVNNDTNPLNYLGLRIAMPRTSAMTPSPYIHSPFPFAYTPYTPDVMTMSGGHNASSSSSAPPSRTGSGWFSAGGSFVRTRTMSSMRSPGISLGMGMTSMPSMPLGHGEAITRKGSSPLTRLEHSNPSNTSLSKESGPVPEPINNQHDEVNDVE